MSVIHHSPNALVCWAPARNPASFTIQPMPAESFSVRARVRAGAWCTKSECLYVWKNFEELYIQSSVLWHPKLTIRSFMDSKPPLPGWVGEHLTQDAGSMLLAALQARDCWLRHISGSPAPIRPCRPSELRSFCFLTRAWLGTSLSSSEADRWGLEQVELRSCQKKIYNNHTNNY